MHSRASSYLACLSTSDNLGKLGVCSTSRECWASGCMAVRMC